MKKLSKAILIAVGAVLALVVAIVFGVNLYIQSPGVQARVQDEISRALRLPLKITNTSVTPWSELRIAGITIPNGDTNLLEAASFNARYRLLPIFSGKLIIYNMSVDNPKLVWPQSAEGKWKFPKQEPVAAAASTGATPQPAAPTESKEPKPKKQGGFQVIVEGFEIKHGSVELLDNAKQPVATFSDVNMLYTTLTPERIEGVANIGRLVWAGTVAFENVRTPFNYTPVVVDLPQISGTIGGGPISGSFNLKTNEPKSPFTFGIKFDQVDLARVASDAKWSEGQSTGTLAGTLDLHGEFSSLARCEGTAHVALQNGRFRELSYFEMIGQALQIRQLSDLRLKDSSIDAHIADEKVNFENLTLDAADLQLTSKEGYARFTDGKLDVHARLIAQNALIQQLPGLVRDNFSIGDGDTRFIDFRITGKAAKPKTDLLDKIVGQKLQTQFDELVNGIFGTKKKKDDDKKKKKKDDAPAAETKKAESGLPPGVRFCARVCRAVRVIAGIACGLPLHTPRTDLRPTMDKVRGAIFDSLGDAVPGARVLDLFAGSGALGIEALSRGATSVTFVEKDRSAVAAIHRNLERTRLSGTVQAADVFGYLDRFAAPESFDLIFADPPYAKVPGERDFTPELVGSEALLRALAPGGTFVLEHLPGAQLNPGERWECLRDKRYGATAVAFLIAARPPAQALP